MNIKFRRFYLSGGPFVAADRTCATPWQLETSAECIMDLAKINKLRSYLTQMYTPPDPAKNWVSAIHVCAETLGEPQI